MNIQSQSSCSEPISDLRLSLLHNWVATVLPDTAFHIVSVAGDASFRRYFRVNANNQSFIVMDAPPTLENCEPFVAIANAFQQSSVRLPKIIALDLEKGFLLLSDFGDQQLLPILNDDSADQLYRSAIDVLMLMQHCDAIPHYSLPHFDDAQYWREFDIFFTWYLQKHQQKNMTLSDETALKKYYQLLIDSAHEQPAVFVHRDYHSRNIMLCEDGELGILDFQDALRGPVTYDLVSLLRDCYIAWPQSQIETWVHYFYEKQIEENPSFSADFSTFLRWFDWMGLQRHLKCLGIFSRLYYRDQKSSYLKDMPRVHHYAMSICDRYPELTELKKYLGFIQTKEVFCEGHDPRRRPR